MAKQIRWGILGAGNIAGAFATALGAVKDAELTAVGSRQLDTAEAFGKKFSIPKRYGSYAALAADPDVDAIYVATPHSLHKENSILCLEAGKAVLCEKPFTINAAEAKAVVAVARAKKLFLMEAMWSRFLPYMAKCRERIAAGAIGDIVMIAGDFGFRSGFDAKSRLYDPALGGGALLDVGVYPISLASMLLGEPAEIASSAELGRSGVDEVAGVILKYTGGRMAVLYTTIRATTPMEATIMGTEGVIRLEPPWWRGSKFSVRKGDKVEVVEMPNTSNGYNYEAEEVGRCLRAGQLESKIMPLDESLAIMRTLDRIRAQWGLKYPME